MRKIIIILLFALTSCAPKKIMVEYNFEKIGSNEEYLADHISYSATREDRKYFGSIMDAFLEVYKDIELEKYVFQYSFSKNKFGDVEVWMMAYEDNDRSTLIEMDGPVRVSHYEGNYYVIVNITQDRAYFHRDSSPIFSLETPPIRSYFYLKGKIKEVENSIEFIYEPTIWRSYDFSDWDTVQE